MSSYANALFAPIDLHRCWPREWKHSTRFKTKTRSSFFSHLVCQAVVKLFKITILPCRLCSFPGTRLNLHHWAVRVEEVNWGREFYSPVKAVTNFWRNKIYLIITHSNYFSVSVGFNPPDNSSQPVSAVGFKPFTDKLRTCWLSLTDTGNHARKVSGTQGTDISQWW